MDPNQKDNSKTGGTTSAGSLGAAPDVKMPYANVPPCPFPTPTRHITTHNAAREAVFSDALSPSMQDHKSVPGFAFYNCYTTATCAHPPPPAHGSTPPISDPSSSAKTDTHKPSSDGVDATDNPSSLSSLPDAISKNEDISFYQTNYPAMTHLDTPHGSVFRILDFAPGAIAPLHRTQTLDYAFVMEGTVEAILDSGETRVMERGSVLVQRGTMHAWKEATGENWARVGFVLLGFGKKGLDVGLEHEEQKHNEKMKKALPQVAAESVTTTVDGDGDGNADAGTPEWKRKYEVRNEGRTLEEWVPWMANVPPLVMVGEVLQAAEKGKGKKMVQKE